MEETFKPITYAPGYFVSDQGRIKKSSGKIMAAPLNAKGYALFVPTLDGVRRFMLLHRVVAEHFLGPVDGHEVRHLDGDKTNNRPENLEIVTGA